MKANNSSCQLRLYRKPNFGPKSREYTALPSSPLFCENFNSISIRSHFSDRIRWPRVELTLTFCISPSPWPLFVSSTNWDRIGIARSFSRDFLISRGSKKKIVAKATGQAGHIVIKREGRFKIQLASRKSISLKTKSEPAHKPLKLSLKPKAKLTALVSKPSVNVGRDPNQAVLKARLQCDGHATIL